MRGDEDHAVRTADTVDRRCRCILEDGELLDIVRVHQVDGTLDAIDEAERRVAAGEGGDTADPEGGTGTRLTVVLVGDDTGHLAAEQGGNLRDGSLELVRGDRGDSAHDAGLLLRTVTDDDGLLNGERARLEGDIGRLVLARQLYVHILVSEERDAKRGVLAFILDGITALGIRDGTIGRILDPNLSTCNRFIRSRIRDNALHCLG